MTMAHCHQCRTLADCLAMPDGWRCARCAWLYDHPRVVAYIRAADALDVAAWDTDWTAEVADLDEAAGEAWRALTQDEIYWLADNPEVWR